MVLIETWRIKTHKGPFNNYVNRNLTFFDHPPQVNNLNKEKETFYVINVNNGLTTHLPPIVYVVIEFPLFPI